MIPFGDLTSFRDSFAFAIPAVDFIKDCDLRISIKRWRARENPEIIRAAATDEREGRDENCLRQFLHVSSTHFACAGGRVIHIRFRPVLTYDNRRTLLEYLNQRTSITLPWTI